MATYAQLAAQFDRVRWAWKRTAALAGVAIVSIEALGIFSLLLLIDVVYRPAPDTRLTISLAGLAALLAMLLWHVLRPLLRKIPDSQLALYVEEHNERFEGALMTAAEFGSVSDGNGTFSAKIAHAVLEAAARRTEREDPRRAVVLTRLKKYALWAIAIVAAYAAGFLTFHDQVAVSARHVLVPLKVTVEETRQQQEREGRPAAPKPIELHLHALSPPLRPDGSLRVPRGGSIELEIVLSRTPQQPVLLNYRVAADAVAATAPLQRLETQSVDKVDTYGVSLKDIDTDLEIFASTGPYESVRHRVGVYEPLVLQGVEIGVQYPAYMQLPDRVEIQADGDVVAPIGAKVTARFLTNRPLGSATITWADAKRQVALLDAAKPESAALSFDVTADTTYSFALVDVDGQQIDSPSPCVVHAAPDEPPTIALQTPATSPLPLHPLGEVNFAVAAADDFGLAGVDLVYLAQTDIDAKEVRVPLKMQLPEGKPAVGRTLVRCTVRLAMEDLVPCLPPGTTISYYLEARDRNPQGRHAFTKLAFINLLPFELWGALGAPHGPEDSKIPDKTLEELLRGVWELHGKRETLPTKEFNQQCDGWANWMLDEQTGKVIPLVVLPPGAKHTPDKLMHLKKGNDYCVEAHAALKAHDTDRALRLLRFAMGEQVAVEFDTTASTSMSAAGGQARGAASTLQTLRVEADLVAKLDQPDKKSAKDDTEAAKEAKKQASGMKQEQDKIIKKAAGQKPDEEQRNKPREENADPHKAAAEKSDAKKSDEKKGGEKKSDAEKDKSHPEAKKGPSGKEKELAAEQTALAGRAKAAAVTIRQTASEKLAKVADKFDQAAHKMTQAADLFAKGETFQGLDRAKDAKTALEKAEDELTGAEQGGMEGEVSALQNRAQRIARQQRELREKVAEIAQAMPDGAAPDAQQDRDLKAALNGQLRLKVDLEKFSSELGELDNHAQKAAKRETAKFIADAVRDMKRGRADQKATNAVVEMTANRPGTATQEQRAVEEVMQRVAAGLENAENTFASDWKSEARRAKREAESVRKAIEVLDKQRNGSASAAARKNQAEETADQAGRLAKHVTARDLAAKNDAEALATMTANSTQLAADLAASEQKRTGLSEIVKRISNHIEAEMQARVDAEKLFSAQREECPPQYRDMVNKYYEALSKARKP